MPKCVVLLFCLGAFSEAAVAYSAHAQAQQKTLWGKPSTCGNWWIRQISSLPSFRSTIWSILYVVLQRIPSSIDPHSSKNTLCYYFFFLSLLFWNHFPKKLPAPRFLSQGAFQCNLDCNILFLCFSGKRTLATQKIDRERESNVESHRLPKYHQIHDEWCVIKDTRTLVDKSFDLFK